MEYFYSFFFNLKSKKSLLSIFGVQGIRLGIASNAEINERASFLQQLQSLLPGGWGYSLPSSPLGLILTQPSNPT